MLLYAVFLRKDASHPLGVLNREGYAQFGTVVAITITLAILIAGLATHRLIPYLSPARKAESAKASLREAAGALRNPALLVLIVCGIVGNMGNGISGVLNTYLYLHFFGLPPQAISAFIVAALPAAILGSVLAPRSRSGSARRRR